MSTLPAFFALLVCAHISQAQLIDVTEQDGERTYLFRDPDMKLVMSVEVAEDFCSRVVTLLDEQDGKGYVGGA